MNNRILVLIMLLAILLSVCGCKKNNKDKMPVEPSSHVVEPVVEETSRKDTGSLETVESKPTESKETEPKPTEQEELIPDGRNDREYFGGAGGDELVAPEENSSGIL